MKKQYKSIHTATQRAGSIAGRMLTVAAVILVVTALSGWIESGTLTARAAVVLILAALWAASALCAMAEEEGWKEEREDDRYE